jgi:hypothetical protein
MLGLPDDTTGVMRPESGTRIPLISEMYKAKADYEERNHCGRMREEEIIRKKTQLGFGS